ncbi:MAG: hypothetical protein ACI4JF_01400 [Oscillospiraceae bacterium]
MLAIAAAFTVLPIIAVIVLLATKKLKGSAFWSGLAVAVISNIIVTVIQLIMLSAGYTVTTITETLPMMIMQLIAAVSNAAFLLLFFGAVLKGSRNMRGAISAASGYTLVTMLGLGMQSFSLYSGAAMINSGMFDSTYAQAIQMGATDKETITTLKQTILDTTIPSLLIYIPNVIAIFLAVTAVAIFMAKGAKTKHAPSVIIAFILHIVFIAAAAIISNTYIAVAVIFVISIAEFAWAMTVRGAIAEEKPAAPEEDDFLRTVQAAQSDDK